MVMSALVGVAIAATGASIVQQNNANKAQRRAQSEQRAGNKSQAMQERRNQIREERIRRAQLLQSASSTGTEGSSGEAGALGGLATNLSSSIGSNLGALQTAQNISIFQQQASDALNRAQIYQGVSSMAQAGATAYGARQAAKAAKAAAPPPTPAPKVT